MTIGDVIKRIGRINFGEFIIAVVLVGIIVSLIYSFTVVVNKDLTPKEGLLLNFLQLLLSLAASWIISQVYAKYSYQKDLAAIDQENKDKLKTYATKAAEKVDNLSKELVRLATYLQNEIDETENSSPEEELLAKEERIISAIHIINTLKSVNDGSLSDWNGVISDEVTKKQTEMKRNELLKEEVEDLLDRYNQRLDGLNETMNATQEKEYAELKNELGSLKRSMDLSISQLGLTPIESRVKKSTKQIVNTVCPICGEPLTYTQRSRANSFKKVICEECKSELVARWNPEKGFMLVLNHPTSESIICPNCNSEQSAMVGLMPGNSVRIECNHCETHLLVTRTVNKLRVKKAKGPTPAKPQLTEETKQKIIGLIPVQPWQKGMSMGIAQQLNLSNRTVQKVVKELIAQGVYKQQIDGVLYDKLVP